MNSDDLIARLGEVKDAIGEWHDWTELANMAEEVLQDSDRCDVLEQIRAGAKERYGNALTLANRLREQYFAQPRSKDKRGVRSQSMKEAVLKASATLAA